MALLQKISDTFWSYVTPDKPTATQPTLQPAPTFKNPAPRARHSSLQDIVTGSRSMTPVERVDSWRVQSSSRSSGSVPQSKKRKRIGTHTAGTRPKVAKMEDENMQDISEVEDEEVQYESDVSMDEEEVDEEVDEVSEEMSNIHVRTPPDSSPGDNSYGYNDSEIDTSLVVSSPGYEQSTPKRKLISPSKLKSSRGVSTEELRAQGWDDDHIFLVQKIAMRGYEPLMPNFWWFEHRFHMPDGLFVSKTGNDADAIISSARGDDNRGIRALQRLMEMGGWMRDRVLLKGRLTPEQEARRMLKEYIKWADADSGLDTRTAIPLLTLVAKSKDTDAEEIKDIAKRKCAALARRYRNAFRVLQSIENSPASLNSTQVAYPIPTIYTLIASHTLIALTAYNPEDPDIKTVGMFDMKDKDYDVWNAFAFAIAVCHLRNVQMRIAEETGLGMKSGASHDEKKDEIDWDL